MNYLAHFHLAWPDEGLVTGGLEGDFLKGPLRGGLRPAVERGVKLHRAIDAYTDGHPLILQLRRELPPGLRRYAGILIDISFDHYLSRHWSAFSTLPLEDFNNGVYRILRTHETALSDGARSMLARLVEHDVLSLYREWDTVLATATRIGSRFKRHNPFLNIERELSPLRDSLERVFLEFYPRLQAFCGERVELLYSTAAGRPLH